MAKPTLPPPGSSNPPSVAIILSVPLPRLLTDAKLISYTINDFSTEIEMESFLNLMEKHGDEFYKKLKKHGLIRWRVNQIWNKAGGFALSSIFEYRDQKAFEKSIEEIKNFQKEHENYFNKVNMKRTSSRSINMLDFNY